MHVEVIVFAMINVYVTNNSKNFKNSKLSKCFAFVNLVRVNLFSTVFHPLINIKVLFGNVFIETAISFVF